LGLKDQDLANLFASLAKLHLPKSLPTNSHNAAKASALLKWQMSEAQAAIAQLNGSEVGRRNLVVK